MRRAFWTLAVGACSLLANAVSAEPGTEGLSLHVARLAGAETCIRGDDLAREIDKRFARPVFSAPNSAGRTVEVVIGPAQSGYFATVRMYDEQGTLNGVREVRSASAACSELSAALLVVLSVMIDPEASLFAPVAPKPAPVAMPEPAPTLVVPPPPAAPEARALTPRERHVSTFVRGTLGFLPAAGLALGVAYEHELKRGGLHVDASASFEREVNVLGPDHGARFSVMTGSALYCPVWFRASLVRLAACAGAEAGVWLVSSFGLSGAHDARNLFAAGTLRGSGTVSLGRIFTLQLTAGVDALVVRPSYAVVLDNVQRQELFTAKSLAPLAELGLGAHW